MRQWNRLILIAGIVASAGLGAGCSPKSLFSRGGDSSISEAPNTHPLNTGCTSVDVPDSAHLDAKSARSLMGCFNRNGALDPIVKLANVRMSDAELQSVLDLANRYVFAKPERFFEMQAAWKSLRTRGVREQVLAQMARVLETRGLVASSLKLVNGAWKSGAMESLLVTLEETGKRLDVSKATTALEMAHAYASSRALGALNDRLRDEKSCTSSRVASCRTDDLVAKLQAFIADARDPQHVDIVTRMARYAVTGELNEFFDRTVGTTETELRSKVPGLASVFTTVYSPDPASTSGVMMDDIASLYHSMNVPIECFGGAASVVNGNMDVLRQLDEIAPSQSAQFFRRDNVLKVMAAAPVCHYPADAPQYYGAMQRFARTSAIDHSTELLQSAWRVTRPDGHGGIDRPLARLLVDYISDTGSGRAGAPENSAGIKLLTPIFVDVTSRGAWNDLLLLLFLPRVEDRGVVADFLGWATQPMNQLGGLSLFESFQSRIIQNARTEDVADLLASLSDLLHGSGSDNGVAPLLASLRSELQASAAHPFLTWATELMVDARSHQDGLGTLLKVSEAPEFQPAVALVGAMARDGRLGELVDALFEIFENRANQGAHPIAETRVTPMPDRSRHKLSSYDAEFRYQPGRAAWDDPTQACDQVRLGDRIDEYFKPGWAENVGNTISCLNTDHRYDDLNEASHFLIETHPEDGSSQNYLSLGVDLIRRFDPGAQSMPTFVDLVVRNVDNGHLFETFAALPYFTSPGQSGRSPWDELITLAPLARHSRSLMRASSVVSADLIEDSRIAAAAGFIRDYPSVGIPEPIPHRDRSSELRRRALDEVKRAYPALREGDASALASRLYGDYDRSISQEWTYEGVRKEIEAHLASVTPATINHLLALARQMGRKADEPVTPERHFTPAEAAHWLVDLSTDLRPIEYQDPAEPGNQATIRLVSSIDMLELMIVNADFMAPAPISKNLALESLKRIGLAWGDEDRKTWPARVQELFPERGKKPETLQQAVEGIQQVCDSNIALLRNTSWIPGLGAILHADLAALKARARNVKAVLPVLFDGLPGASNPHAGGDRILRQLFYELWAASPAACQGANADSDRCSSLKLIGVAGRLGLTHEISRVMRGYDRNDPRLAAMVAGLAAVGDADSAAKIGAIAVTQDPDFSLAFAALKQSFETLDHLSQQDGEASPGSIVIESAIAAVGEASRMPGLVRAGLDSAREFAERGFAQLRKRPDLVAEATDALIRAGASRETTRQLARWASTEGSEGRLALTGLLQRALDAQEPSTRRLRDEAIASGLTLIKDKAEEQRVRAAVNTLRELVRALGELSDRPGFPRERVDEVVQGILDGLAGRTSPDQARLIQALRADLASVLRTGELEQLILLVDREPERVSQVLTTLNRLIASGDLEQYVRTSLQSLGH